MKVHIVYQSNTHDVYMMSVYGIVAVLGGVRYLPVGADTAPII